MTKITGAMLNDIEDIEFTNIDYSDYPDFCDAYINSASWISTGKALTDEELDDLMDNYSDWVYSKLEKYLY